MSISLTSAQERFVQTKLDAGKYRSAEEVIEALKNRLGIHLPKEKLFNQT